VNSKYAAPGWHPNSDTDRSGHFTIVAWDAPLFAPRDPDTKIRPRMLPNRSIVVTRFISEEVVGPPTIMWDDGREISSHCRKMLSKRIQARIVRAIADTRRIAGAK
jgi:hypothetical protein